MSRNQIVHWLDHARNGAGHQRIGFEQNAQQIPLRYALQRFRKNIRILTKADMGRPETSEPVRRIPGDSPGGSVFQRRNDIFRAVAATQERNNLLQNRIRCEHSADRARNALFLGKIISVRENRTAQIMLCMHAIKNGEVVVFAIAIQKKRPGFRHQALPQIAAI